MNVRNLIKTSKIIQSILLFFGTHLIIRILGLTNFPDFWFEKLYPFFSKILIFMSAKFPVAIGDLLYAFLILVGISLLILGIRFLILKKYEKLEKGVYYLINFLTLLNVFFHLIWGFNYYKTPIKASYNVEMDSVDELKKMVDFYYEKAAALREKVQEDERGVFVMSISEDELKKEILNASYKLQEKHPELKFFQEKGANLKPSVFSTPVSYLGILGYYNPFTSEANYNSKMPDSKLVFTKFHETAHQWGFASEAEANFVGFLLGKESQHFDLQYASYFKAMRSILNRILWVEPEYVLDYVECKYTEGMKRDRLYELEVNAQYGGAAEDAFSLMNEAFLRLNNQEGLESYGKFIELIVGYNRKYGLN